jgi:hypothetical protein
MPTQLCPFRLHSQPQPPSLESPKQGQVLVVFAVALFALVVFIGLAIDIGSVYVTYGQLKRAVDSASIAAANEFKAGQTLNHMDAAAYEVLQLHNIDMNTVDMHVYICDAYTSTDDKDLNEPFAGPPDGNRDRYLQTVQPLFYSRCPYTDNGLQPPRKLIWVDAEQRAPLFFLTLMGFNNIPLQTNAIAEAAPVDLVLVIDISESMGSETVDGFGDPSYVVGNFDPVECNANNNCQPLLHAKTAANELVSKMHNGYDRVAVVTFDSSALTHPIENTHGISTSLSDDMTKVSETLSAIQLHDDPPFIRLWPNWWQLPGGYAFNPVNPEDRDGDGFDADPGLPTCADNPTHPFCCSLDDDRWDVNPGKFGGDYSWGGGFPCDDDNLFDSYDWDQDGIFTINDHQGIIDYLDPDGDGIPNNTLSPLSTCTGCGIREASTILASSGRSNSVWVIILLSDGSVNLSDRPPLVDSGFTNGFCFGKPLDNTMWFNVCRDQNLTPRVCIDQSASTCPPGSLYENPGVVAYEDLTYSVYDYALDMVDQTALLFSNNINEPAGNNIGIYSIGLGDVGQIGENLLRYMAAVGDDGDRATNPCSTTPAGQSCGQYYYAPTGDDLLPIFENIASSIYTRLTQ